MTHKERRELAKKRLANPALYLTQTTRKIDERADNHNDKLIDRNLIAWY